MMNNAQISILDRKLVAYIYLNRFVLRDTFVTDPSVTFTPIHLCLDVLRQRFPDAMVYDEPEKYREFLQEYEKYDIHKVYRRIMEKYNIVMINSKDDVGKKNFYIKNYLQLEML